MTPRSLILDVCVDAVFPLALLFSTFLLFAGHNAPGGGFAGGLVVGAAMVLRWARGGVPDLRRSLPLPAPFLLGGGVMLAGVSGTIGWLRGGQFQQTASLTLDLGLLGTAKVYSSLVFDIGVYLAVIGVVLTVLDTLGGDAQS